MSKKLFGVILALASVIVSTALGGMLTLMTYVVEWMVFDPTRIGNGTPSLFLQGTGLFLAIFEYGWPVIGFTIGLCWAKGVLQD